MKSKIYSVLFVFFIIGVGTGISAYKQIKDLNLNVVSFDSQLPMVFDRNYQKLHVSFHDQWNSYVEPIESFPPFLLRALIESEDQRFYSHLGIDPIAKMRAIYQNIITLSFQQGGSTITEQVVRILIGRPDNLWSRLIQSCLAVALEVNYTKEAILEFYLNQVPFASNRRGFFQASNLYLDRDLDTLSESELLALVVLLRAPSRFDIRKNDRVRNRVELLAETLNVKNLNHDYAIDESPNETRTPVRAFVNLVMETAEAQNNKIVSSLDLNVQQKLSFLLKHQVEKLKPKNVFNGAAMVVDLANGEILAMVSENGSDNEFGFNTALVPRQPGSTLKPFLYAEYFMKGGRPSDIVDDAPISTAVGGGLHEVNNYSHKYYGKLSLREALGNSLNIPAVKLAREVGVTKTYNTLQSAGLTLPRGPIFYGEGLALGNAEVSLFEMMRAYTCLANRGQCLELRMTKEDYVSKRPRLFDQFAADIVLDIISDAEARKKEFGSLYFNHQVAMKTGTSTDFRDAWAFVMNRRFLIGIWVGNLNSEPMNEVTGAIAALPVAKNLIESSMFKSGFGGFSLSSLLKSAKWCFPLPEGCEYRDDLFLLSDQLADRPTLAKDPGFTLEPDSKKITMAIDPRIPIKNQIIKISSNLKTSDIEWFIDGESQGHSDSLLFPLREGEFEITANYTKTNEVKDVILEIK